MTLLTDSLFTGLFRGGLGIYSFGTLLSLTTVWKTGRGAEVTARPHVFRIELIYIDIYIFIYRYKLDMHVYMYI